MKEFEKLNDEELVYIVSCTMECAAQKKEIELNYKNIVRHLNTSKTVTVNISDL